MKTSISIIEKKKQKLKEKMHELEHSQLNGVRELLTDSVITEICRDCNYSFRNRLLPPISIIFHMIAAGFSRDGSFQSAWHNAGGSGCSDILAKGRKRIPLLIWEAIDQWIVGQIGIETKKQDLWRNRRVIITDGTCLSMSDEQELAAAYGRASGQNGKSRFPLARVVFACTMNTQVIIGHAMGAYKCSEKALFAELQSKYLQKGDIIVADRGFAGGALYCSYV